MKILHYKKIIIAFALALLSPSWAFNDYMVTRDTPTWFKETFYDFSDDVAEATAVNKRVMVYFGQDGCGACVKLHKEVFNNTKIRPNLIKHFDAIAINIHGDIDITWVDGKSYTEKSLSEELGIEFTPSLVFLDEDGNIALQFGGYLSRKQFREAANYVITKREKKESFSAYRKRLAL